MAVKRNYKGTEAFELLSFVLLMIVFLGIGFFDGPQLCVDSSSYVEMEFSREPGYPLFLAGLRKLCEVMNVTATPFDLPAYLTLALTVQSLLWVVAIYRLGIYVLGISKYAVGSNKAMVLAGFAQITQVAVALANRFVSGRRTMYSESILTESLAMPLFLLFTLLLLKSYDTYEIKECIELFLLSVLICSIRKQMLICVILWFFTSFILHIFVKRLRSLKRFSYTVIGVVLTLVTIALLDRGYNLAVRGVFAPHTCNSLGGLTTVFYTSTEEDPALFLQEESDDYPGLDGLVTRIVDTCKAEDLTIDSAEGFDPEGDNNIIKSDWKSMTEHYSLSYDVISYSVVLSYAEDYVEQHFGEKDTVRADILIDKVIDRMFKVLLAARIRSAFKGDDHGAVYLLTANVLKAFVISITNIHPVALITLSAVLYCLYLVMYIVIAVRTLILAGKDPRAVDLELLAYWRKLLLVGFVVMTVIAINSVVTGSIIFPQPRYMTYSTGLFYMSLFGLILH